MSAENSSLARMIAALCTITILSAAILATVYSLTEEPIALSADKTRREAIAAVTGEFDNNPVAEAASITPEGETEALALYPVTLGGHPAGAAVETYSDTGFSDRIRLMVGFDSEGRVTGYQVLAHTETPGLGAKMDQWFRDSRGNRSIIGRNPSAGALAVSKDGGEVDAITAATITSRAFLEAVNRASECFTLYRTSQQQ